MNIEEYKNTSDKLEYFQSLTNEEKKELYKMMTSTEKRELLSVMSLQNIKDFILTFPKLEQQEVYKELSDSQLRAIYNSFNDEEKKNMIAALESRQTQLNNRIEESRNNIQTSTSNIEKATNSIENSRTNIAITKENIQAKKQELKNNKATLKKLNRERKSNLRKVMQSKKKLNGRLSKIGIISKYRTKKYLNRLNELEKSNVMIDEQKIINQQTRQEIRELKANIIKENANIEKQQAKIQEEYKNINTNVSRIDRTEKQIKKLSKSEKKILGRKLYNQVVYQRDCIAVRKKKEQQQKVENNKNKQPQQTENNQNKQPQQVERIEQSQVEVISPQQTNTEAMVTSMIDNATRLQEMGVNFYPPAVTFGNIPNSGLLQNPITQINQQQLILISYTMMALYNYTLQKMMMQQQQQAQELSNGHTRTLSPNSRGIVNLTLLASIVFFTVGLLLFILK